MIWNIITDSSCDYSGINYNDGENEIRFSSVPFVISVDKKDYIDDENINITNMLDDMEKCKDVSHTACPAPGTWAEQFGDDGNVIAVTISKELSGSFNSANTAKEIILEKSPSRKIEVINSISAGPGLTLVVQNIVESIKSKKTFEEAVKIAHSINQKKQTIFALCSFNNLVKNGRISPVMGFLAKKLNMWGIGAATSIGQIEIKGKVRGAKKALATIINNIAKYESDVKCKVKKVVISHCKNLELAEELRDRLKEKFQNISIEIHETKGLCSYYAEKHGLIVSYM